MAVEQAQDSAIVQAVLSGRHEAFEALVARYFETVRMVALAKTANMADAEDVAQETFLKAYESLGALRNQAKLAPWLVVISRNLAVSVVRRREREKRLAPEAAAAHSVQADHEQREFHDGVAKHVETLPESLREVVLLYYFEGLRTAEIAERLELSANAVVKRLARGREILGDRLLRAWGAEA